MFVAQIVLTIASAYFGFGLLFGLVFVFSGVHRVDSLTRHSGAGFRLLILPGSVLFWPLLLKRYLRTEAPR